MKRATLRTSSVIAFLILTATAAIESQLKEQSEAERYVQAVDRYRSGDVDGAVDALRRWPPDELAELAKRVVQSVRRRARARIEPSATSGIPLPAASLGAAASLHMEAAMQNVIRETVADRQALTVYINVAQSLFDEHALQTRRGDLAPDWHLAIGLTAMAESRFDLAADLLERARVRYPAHAPLALAAGTALETLATRPADIWSFVGPVQREASTWEEKVARGKTSQPLSFQDARILRNQLVRGAQRVLESSLELRDRPAEAYLRLAHLHTLQRANDKALRLLELFMERADGQPPHLIYVGHLLLARTKLRGGHFGEVATAIKNAMALFPDVDGAHVERISLGLALGDPASSMAAATEMLTLPRQDAIGGDPWFSYRLGQFWKRDQLVVSLRAEARK